MNKKLISLSSASLLLVLPITVFAVNFPGMIEGGNIDTATVIDNIFGFIWPIFIAFAILMFIVAGFLFLTARGDPGKVKDARNAVLWGTIGVVVGILASSIPFIIKNALGTFA